MIRDKIRGHELHCSGVCNLSVCIVSNEMGHTSKLISHIFGHHWL